eukprot:20784-Prymnesium_polylepis.1
MLTALPTCRSLAARAAPASRTAPLARGEHQYIKMKQGKTCAYCGKSHGAYQFLHDMRGPWVGQNLCLRPQ